MADELLVNGGAAAPMLHRDRTHALPATVHPATPAGFGPADVASAYDLPGGSMGSGQTVAIVDAFDDPNAESDLATYRSYWGLPACTTANGCFAKVDQNGGSNYPTADSDWGIEISLDLDAVSAACPNCHILLIEAANDYDLNPALDRAAAMHATEVSMSWGTDEYSSETSDDSHIRASGIAYLAAAGDSGYGTEYPAASPDVIAVGGTSLSRNGSARGWGETAWD